MLVTPRPVGYGGRPPTVWTVADGPDCAGIFGWVLGANVLVIIVAVYRLLELLERLLGCGVKNLACIEEQLLQIEERLSDGLTRVAEAIQDEHATTVVAAEPVSQRDGWLQRTVDSSSSGSSSTRR